MKMRLSWMIGLVIFCANSLGQEVKSESETLIFRGLKFKSDHFQYIPFQKLGIKLSGESGILKNSKYPELQAVYESTIGVSEMDYKSVGHQSLEVLEDKNLSMTCQQLKDVGLDARMVEIKSDKKKNPIRFCWILTKNSYSLQVKIIYLSLEPTGLKLKFNPPLSRYYKWTFDFPPSEKEKYVQEIIHLFNKVEKIKDVLI